MQMTVKNYKDISYGQVMEPPVSRSIKTSGEQCTWLRFLTNKRNKSDYSQKYLLSAATQLKGISETTASSISCMARSNLDWKAPWGTSSSLRYNR